MPLLISCEESMGWENAGKKGAAGVSGLRQTPPTAIGHNRDNALEQGLLRGCISGATVSPTVGAAPENGGLIARGVV
ncbi:hypothetical protein, partial [Pseudomonas protegens]|uniref:hypothetical protein n=1 Tax=Pseudomonas protegens TaxID=380021 RepID=UPI00223B1AAF